MPLAKTKTELSAKDRSDLEECESAIGSGLETFLQVGEALTTIRERKLYRETHATFEAYCEGQWEISRHRAYDLIGNVAVAKSLEPPKGTNGEMCKILHTTSENESHLRELKKVPAENRIEVIERAAEAAPPRVNGKPAITAQVIREVAAEVAGDAKDETPVDQEGNKIESKGVQAAFAERAKFVALQRKVSALKAEFAELCDGNAGRYAERQQQQFDAEVGNLHAIIRFSIPHAVCPYCGGRKCDSCKQSGWMSEDLYKAVPGELKGA